VEQHQPGTALAYGVERKNVDPDQDARLTAPIDDGLPVGFGDSVRDGGG
jgi:hypothetical protein